MRYCAAPCFTGLWSGDDGLVCEYSVNQRQKFVHIDEQLILSALNLATSAEQVLAIFNSGGQDVIDPSAAEDILAARALQPQRRFTNREDVPIPDERFSSAIRIGNLADDSATWRADFERRFDRVPERFPDPFPFDRPERLPPDVSRSTDYPVLLFPIRLETRFKDGELLIRIFPDQVAVDMHEPRLTAAELLAGQEYASAVNKQDAWRELSRKAGSQRAAWIVRAVANNPHVRPEDESWFTIPKPMMLPARFVAYLFDDNGMMRPPIDGEPVNQEITLFSASPEADEIFDDASRWMRDFDQAEADGMAIRVPGIPSAPNVRIRRLIVVGLGADGARASQRQLERLIDSHHYSTGMEFIESYTPTNNTQRSSSAHSASTRNDEDSYSIEIEGPTDWIYGPQDRRTNAGRLGHALGLGLKPESLRYIANSGDRSASYVKDMHTALWPVTGGYYLRYLLSNVVPPNTEGAIAHHFIEYVRPRGVLPGIRVGSQPYGVLPVTKVRGFVVSEADAINVPANVRFDTDFYNVLDGLLTVWQQWAHDDARVPRVSRGGDSDEQLLQVLSMEPVSLSYRARPFIDERLVGYLLVALREKVFGPESPFYQSNDQPWQWVREWANEWHRYQEEVADEWEAVTQVDSHSLLQSALMRIFAWWSDRDVEVDFQLGIADREPDEDQGLEGEYSKDYLRILCEQGSGDGEAGTLLRDLLQRSLDMTEPSSVARSNVETAICNMATASIVEFFNYVTRPEELTRRMVDENEFDFESTRERGIGHRLARRILAERERQDRRAFANLDQIREAFRGRAGAFGEFVRAFRDKKAKPDVDNLLRETLDAFTHRLDSWISSFATRRLEAMRDSHPHGINIGAYGWLEDITPMDVDDQEAPEQQLTEGYIHTPSRGQSAAAAVMHNAYLTHRNGSGANAFRMNLNSHRVRHAFRVMDGIRQGQPLGGLLGYQYERSLQESRLDQYVHDIRAHFPLIANKDTPAEAGESVDAIAANNVVDGLAFVRWWQADPNRNDLSELSIPMANVGDEQKLVAHLRDVVDTLDAVSDVLMYEGVYHSVQGNYERGAAAMDAAAGAAMPPKIESLATPVNGKSVSHRLCILFREELVNQLPGSTNPRVIAEPRIAGWMDLLMPDLSLFGCDFVFRRLNINAAPVNEVASIPGLDAEAATAIVEHRDRAGQFEFLHQLRDVTVLDENRIPVPVLTEARYRDILPWLSLGIEEDVDSTHYRRVNLNTAAEELLARFNGIDADLATDIRDSIQADGAFSSLDELVDRLGIEAAVVDANRQWLAVRDEVVSLDELNLDAVDLLYLSTNRPTGEDTELEQRIKFLIKTRDQLTDSVYLRINTTSVDGFAHSIDEAFDLCAFVHTAFSAGELLRPGMLSLPSGPTDDDAELSFSQSQVDAFDSRLQILIELVNEIVTSLGGDPIANYDGGNLNSTTNEVGPDEVEAVLERVSHFGISGVFPASGGVSSQQQRKDFVSGELHKRAAAFNALRSNALVEPNVLPDRKMRLLVEAAKELFAGNMIVLPVCTPLNSADLEQAFDDDDLFAPLGLIG